MIDNPTLTASLITKLKAALPLPATITPHLASSLRKQAPDTSIPKACRVLSVFNMGDEGGIMCELSLEGQTDAKVAFLASITHLDFDRRLPLAREIAGYQKRRTRKLRRQVWS